MSRDLFGEPLTSGALLDTSGLYRYRLWRVWSPRPRVAFVMLNPSTADAKVDDPTIRRCMAFARQWGAGGIDVVNLFAYRATNPKVLKSLPLAIAVGAENDAHVAAACKTASRAVVAWGTHGRRTGRDIATLILLEENGVRPWCLGHTAGGDPRHPLYLTRETVLEPFEWVRAGSTPTGGPA